MVKFSKELQAQLIPEWKGAFMNYWELKKQVKKIKLIRKSNTKQMASSHHKPLELEFGSSIFDPLRDAISKVSAKLLGSSEVNSLVIKEAFDKVMECRRVNEHKQGKGEEGNEEEINGYGEEDECHLLTEASETKVFFEKVGAEMKKVNQFYKTREREFLDRGKSLNKQLQIVQNLKRLNSNCRCTGKFSQSLPVTETPNGSDQSSSVKPTTMAVPPLTTLLWEELVGDSKNKCEVGGLVRRKNNLQSAEKLIRDAFVELYRGLGLLKSYSSLNMLGFIKILKKFDKVSNQHASSSYIKALKRFYFLSSDKVVRQMDDVESNFTKHFTNSDRKKAMKFLRPQNRTDTLMLTFFVGLFTGCFVALFSVYVILAHLFGTFSAQTLEEAAYMETVYPFFSMFALLSLHVFMYGCNLLMWKSTRINSNFIFENCNTPTHFKYTDAFLVSTVFMTAIVGVMVIHLILRQNQVLPQQVDAIPGILLLVFILLLICPLNILYGSTRYRFMRALRNIACAPFYKVFMVDFFIADQLTSQIPLLRHMESTACYLMAGSFRTHQYETCKSGKLYRDIAYVISFLPYYWRAMQCARRWFDECDVNHLANLGKYVSAMVAAAARLIFARQQNKVWMVIVLVTSVITTLYQLYWDFVKDWGVLNPNSRNPWLRDDLVLNKKSTYYISIVLNLLLRVVWVETVIRFNMGMFESQMMDFLLASLEVIRRSHWNFYRLENEHLNNVGKFRAVRMSPLPFLDTDSDG